MKRQQQQKAKNATLPCSEAAPLVMHEKEKLRWKENTNHMHEKENMCI